MAGTSAVVITYNSEEVVEACIRALREHAPEVRVVVVDNGSADRTVALARAAGAEVIPNRENRGFAGGVNHGFRAVDTELVLVMNPDVQIQTGLEALERAARKHGMAAGVLTNGDGAVQSGFTIRRFPTPASLSLELLGIHRVWPKNPWSRRYRYEDWDLTKGGTVEQPAGAFLMIRRDVWANLGGMDEQFYPIWFEDVDFCRRATEAGCEIQFVPEVQARHLGGHSIKSIDGWSRQVQWYDSLLRYGWKHFQPSGYLLVWTAGVLGTIPRVIAGVIQERSLRPIGCFFKIVNLLGSRLVSRPPSGQTKRPGSDY